MSYDVIRSVRQLIESGIGDVGRLAHILDRLENGKYLYLSDQKYLENLLSANGNITSNPAPTEPHGFENLETELRDINIRLEKILRNKTRTESKITNNIQTVNTDSTSGTSINNITLQNKSEDTTLLLSVVLGLISLQGIGHIYIRKIVKGIGILAMSLIFSSFSVLYFSGIIKESVPSFLQYYLIPILVGGYFGLYAFQILDSRRLCAAYNAYIFAHKKRPSWW